MENGLPENDSRPLPRDDPDKVAGAVGWVLERDGSAAALPGFHSRFAAIVESVEQQKTRMRAHLAELDTLFASLHSRAFNDEL